MQKESIGKYIAIIHRNSQSILNKKFENYDIGSGQHDFLYILSNNEGITQKELSEELKIGKATTAKSIKSLEKSGYVRREKYMKDKRFYKLYLTDKGKEIAPMISSTFKEMLEIFSDGFSEEEYNNVLNSLKKILSNVYNIKNNQNCDK